MPEYYLKRLAYKVLSWFIPKREWRVAFGKKMGFGERVVSVEEVDLYIPRGVLDSINLLVGNGHCALSDKSGNLRSDFQSLTPSKLPQSSLDNPLFSSQSLECPGKPSAEIQENTESRVGLDSRFNNSDSESSFTDSKGNTEILNNEQKQSPSGVEPSTDSESSSTDSKTSTESKEILKNEQTQNLSPKESTESKVDLESRFRKASAQSKAFTESSPLDSQPKAIAQSSSLDSQTNAQSKPTNAQAQNQANTAQDRIYNPNPFLHTYKARLNPTPLATIVAKHSSFAPPPFVA